MSKLRVVEPDGGVSRERHHSDIQKDDIERLEAIAVSIESAAVAELIGQVRIGKALNEARSILKRDNQFGEWREARLPWLSRNEALKRMQIAEMYGDRLEAVSHLSFKTLAELSAPKTPIEVREEIEKMIDAGELVTSVTVKELRLRLEKTEKALADGDSDMLDRLMDSTSRIKELQEANAELVKKHEATIAALPVQVAPPIGEAALRAKIIELEQSLNEAQQKPESPDVKAIAARTEEALRAGIETELEDKYASIVRDLQAELLKATQAPADTNVTLIRPEFDEESVSARYQARIDALEAKLAAAEARSAETEQLRWAPDGTAVTEFGATTGEQTGNIVRPEFGAPVDTSPLSFRVSRIGRHYPIGCNALENTQSRPRVS